MAQTQDPWFKIKLFITEPCGTTLLQTISPFPTVFSKDLYCRHLKTRAYSGKG